MDIIIEPWKKLIIHEIIEYKFEDWVKQIAFSTRSSGGGIPTMQWTNGIVFASASLPTTNVTVEEQLKGILHWSSVSFVVGRLADAKTIPLVHCIVGIPPPEDLVLNAICFTQSSNLYSIIS